MPSISLLPAIANIFNVSIDELYDIDKHTNDEKVSAYEAEYTALCSKGDNKGRVELMRRALEEYPRNYKFINYLARSLYRCGNIDLYATEIIMLCDRILEDCKTDNIRFSALQTIARTYNDIGQHKTALQYAYEMPSMASSREFFLGEILTGEERIEQLQKNIFFLSYNAGKAITYLASDSRGMGKQLSHEDKIRMYTAANTIYETIADDGNYLMLNGKFYWHYRWIAKHYCLMGDTDKAMKNLLIAERTAVGMDRFIKENKERNYTSLFLNKVTSNPQDALKHWRSTNCNKMYAQLQDGCFDTMRDMPEFKELELRLKEQKKGETMPSLKSIDNGKTFDWGKTSSDYARYRDIYPDEFYKRIMDLGLCTKGQKVLDLGTGTGVLPRNMYKYGAEFTGADISENQIAYARQLSADNGMDIKYVVASAETIDFSDNTFDVVTACQCFMYFNKEIALPKIYNVLKPNGHFCILFMAYLPFESEIAAKSEELILKYNPDWNGVHYNPNKKINSKTPDWCKGMFVVENHFGYEVDVKFTRESWNGRMKACRGIGASSLNPEKIAAWENEHMAYLETTPDNFDIPHWVTMLNLRKI